MKRLTMAMAAAALVLAMGSAAAAPKNKEIFEPGKPLAEQITKIEADLSDGETYSEITLDQRSRVREALGRMRGIVERNGSEASLSAANRSELFNDQHVVHTVLTQAREDSRLICRRERVVGSNMPQTQCMTVAQRERVKNTSQSSMDRAQRVGRFSN
ncbi:hypothetical protein ABE424_17990 [Stenotrophomonas sp. TWI1149]|uniref:hypothetical protein n=1 Tax=unclassified Stenotrophomonas TaxID=196198 RepID=UPI00320874E4